MKNRYSHLTAIDKPYQYVGHEENTWNKDFSSSSVRFCLAFADSYEVGMSNLGMQILYHVINSDPRFMADRAFAPMKDMAKYLKENNEQLSGRESGRPLKDFDLLGFSLQFELCYTNVLYMLDLAGIPIRRDERENDFCGPFVFAGGPSTVNPAPMEDFFDFIVVGEGEEVVIDICNVFTENKEKKLSRKKMLSLFSEIEGVYVPSIGKKASRRIIKDLDSAAYPTKLVLPGMRPIHDRLSIEIQRGCARGCRFCQAGYTYRPKRERNAEKILKIAEESLCSTGSDELNFLSLSSTDYSQIHGLLAAAVKKFQASHTTVSLPSLRVETLEEEYLELLNLERKAGFTIAPEAGSQRLRDVINKKFTEEEIISSVEKIFQFGWYSVKMYFMIGLPTETDDDLRAIGELVNKICRFVFPKVKGRRNITVSLSNFVPKPHTPFQWCEQIPVEEIKRRQKVVLSSLNKKNNMTFKTHDAELSLIEGILSRGSRLAGRLVETAFSMGASFDAWHEGLKYNVWMDAVEILKRETGVDVVRESLGAKDIDAKLPWDMIDIGVDESYLKSEYQKSLKEETTLPCSEETCHACGLCNFKGGIGPTKSTSLDMDHLSDTCLEPIIGGSSVAAEKRFLFKYQKIEAGILVTTLDLQNILLKALKRSNLTIAYNQKIKPRPKLTMGPALPLGVASEGEFFMISIHTDKSATDIAAILNRFIPEHLKIISGKEVHDHAGIDIPDKISFLVPISEIVPSFLTKSDLDVKIAGFNNATNLTVERERIKRHGGVQHTIVDVRAQVTSINCVTKAGPDDDFGEYIKIETKPQTNGQSINPYFVLETLLAGSSINVRSICIFKN